MTAALIVGFVTCGLAAAALAARRGYPRSVFLIAGLLAGPVALLAAVTASQYAADTADDDDADLASLPGETPDPPASSTPQQADGTAAEPKPTSGVYEPSWGPRVSGDPAEPRPVLSVLDLARQEVPRGRRARDDEADANDNPQPTTPPKKSRGKHRQDRQDSSEFEAFADDEPLTPVRPGVPTFGVCPSCEQPSYADFYGLCARCPEPFPVAVALSEQPEHEHAAATDEPVATAKRSPKTITVFGMPLLPNRK